MITLSTIAGVLGAILICFAYFLLQFTKIDPKGKQYNFVNLVGAILLTYSLIENWNLGSFLIELFWMAIAITALVKCYLKKDKS